MNYAMLFGILRHILTVAGGALVTKGYTDDAGLQQIVGALCTIAGIVWSIMHKKSLAPTDQPK